MFVLIYAGVIIQLYQVRKCSPVFNWPNHFGAEDASFWMLEPDL